MHRLALSALAVLALATSALAQSATWNIDPAHSTIGFGVRHMMVSTVRGKFTKFTGTITGDPAKPTEAVIDVTIDASSIDTENEKRDDHLRGADFFDVAKFPTITFKSKQIAPGPDGTFLVTGDLTMHGTTKELVLTVSEFAAPIQDPMGNLRGGGHVTGKLDRQAYGIDFSKTMDAGGLLVGNEVTISVDVEATKAK
ncbi:MAG: YceI family protein [bacterium]|nr:YceI family protein [bacterium]